MPNVKVNLEHKPVLVQEVLNFLPPKPHLVIDATCGLGGHSAAIAAKCQMSTVKCQIICLDFDCASLKLAQKRLKKWSQKTKFFCANFTHLKKILKNHQADFILADLGFSSWQLETNRGLSFSQNQTLDMRLDKKLKTTATDLVNHLPERDLADLIYQNSGERLSRQISQAIVKKRPLFFTSQLNTIIQQAVGKRYQGKISPSTRTFQALRIAVNQELANLEKFLQIAPSCLANNGCLAIITFHSLEERLVRKYFKQLTKTHNYTLLTPQPLRPTIQEIQVNHRARSAKLRVIKKLI